MPKRSTNLVIAAVLLGLPTALTAQQSGVVTQDADDRFDLGTLVLTTARRTLEDVSDVPGSVEVLTGETLERSNVDDFNEAVRQLPNVNVATAADPRQSILSIRGISSQNIAATAPTVGVFQNGVLQNSTGLRFNNSPDLVDLERVEVLFGPQGTAYGRGTVGGAVNFVTAKPVFERETRVTLGYDSLEEGTAEVVFNTPLSDTLALRAVVYGDMAEGFVSTPFAGGGNLGNDNYGTRISLRYQPNDRLTIDGSVQYDESSYDAPLYATLPSIAAGNPVSLVNQVPGNNIERINLFFEIGYEFEAGLLTSTTGYLDSHLNGTEDFDFSQINGSLLGRDNFVDTFSQEIRFESRDFDVSSGTVSFNLGANYSYTSSNTLADFQVLNPVPGRSQAVNQLDVENYGVFGDVRWRPIEPLEITLGGRYSEDNVRIDSVGIASGSLLFFADPPTSSSASYSAVTPSLSVLYDWTDSVATYATVSSGYKPGGFSGGFIGGVSVNRPFEEEHVVNYEVGLKSNFFDGALGVNASLFLIDFDNIQVPIPINLATLSGGGIDNAASALSEGAELSFIANPMPGLTINGGVGYTNARFLQYINPLNQNLSGTALPNAPEFTYNLSADYEFASQVGQLTPFVRAEFNGTSGFERAAGAAFDVGDYNLVNLRAGLRGENVDLTLFVENLFDETYVVDSIATGVGTGLGVPGEPRKVGFLATVRF